MHFWEAIVLGLVQGLTEFFPISSSAHIEIGTVVLGRASEANLVFSLLLHLATVCSTVCVFRQRLKAMWVGFWVWRWTSTHFWILCWVLSAVPAAIVGLTLEAWLTSQFGGNLVVVGSCLCITGLLLMGSYFVESKRERPLGLWSSIGMGVAQAVALLPGISRSGATLSMAAFLGVKKEEAAFFSFMMALLPITGAALLKGLQWWTESPDIASLSLAPWSLIGGFLAAFTSGYFACKYVVQWVQKGKLHYFSLYCITLGIATLVWAL